VGVDFTPYETCGSWVWTDDYGWVYGCDWEWGWLPFHYGQWGWFDDYWAWVPDYEWSPAWVDWRGGGGYVGWAPSVPVVRDHRTHTHTPRDHRRGDRDTATAQGGVLVQQRDSHWRFAKLEDFGKRNIRAHLFKHAAEGLRVTSLVPRPPVRGNVRPVSAAAVMGDRHRPVHRARPAIDYTPPAFTPRAPARSQASALRETPTAVEVPMENPPSIYEPGDRFREPTQSPIRSSAAPIDDARASAPRDIQPATPKPSFDPPPRAPQTYQPPRAPTYTPPPQPTRAPQTYQPPRAPTYTPPSQPTRAPQTYQPPRAPSYSPPSHSTGSSSGGGVRSHRR
jgi:hypothetical protein